MATLLAINMLLSNNNKEKEAKREVGKKPYLFAVSFVVLYAQGNAIFAG